MYENLFLKRKRKKEVLKINIYCIILLIINCVLPSFDSIYFLDFSDASFKYVLLEIRESNVDFKSS